MLSSLQQMLEHRRLWRARDNHIAGSDTVPSGWRHLDAALLNAGWPRAALSEILCAQPELAVRLLQPVLAQCTQRKRLLVWVAMPWLPYAPAWQKLGVNLNRVLVINAPGKHAVWAIEQALRLARGAVVVSSMEQLDLNRSRRLQLAAQAGESMVFLLRPLSALNETNAASVRLQLETDPLGLKISVHKRRGAYALAPFILKAKKTDMRWPARPILPPEINARSQDLALSWPLVSATSESVNVWQ